MVPSLLLFKPTPKKKENIDPSSTLTILINITNVTTGPPGASVRASPAPKFWFASTAPLPRKVAPDSSALPGGYLKEAGGFSSDPPWKMGKIPWKIHDRSKLPGIYPQNLMVFAIQTRRFWILILECYIPRKTGSEPPCSIASWDPHPMKLSGCHHRRISVMERLFGNLLSVLLY